MSDNSFNATKLILIQFIAVLLLVFNQAAHAETKYYDVEVIIYEDANATYLHSEDWQDEASFRQENQNDALSATPEPVVPLQSAQPLQPAEPLKLMPVKKLINNNPVFQNIEPTILNKEAKRIQHSSHYNLLFYAAWRQPGLDAKNAVTINLKDLINHAQLKTQNSIKGTLKVVLSRYLHFYTKLNYLHHEMAPAKIESAQAGSTLPTPVEMEQDSADTYGNNDQTPANEPTQLVPVIKDYPVVSHRRMRSKVLHYIDYPLVGIVVQINQATPAEVKKMLKPSVKKPDASKVN